MYKSIKYRTIVIKNPHEELAHFQAVQTLKKPDALNNGRNDASIYLEKMTKSIFQKGLFIKI